jgi:hypothetical protein
VSKVTPPVTTAAVVPVTIQPILTQTKNLAKCVANKFKGEFLTSKISGLLNNRYRV